MKSLGVLLILLISLNSPAQTTTSGLSKNTNFECLDAAQKWIYRNTSDSSDQASQRAIAFCRDRGDLSCLEETKNWIYRNTSASSNEAAEKALESCRSNVVCKEVRNDRRGDRRDNNRRTNERVMQ